MHPLTPITLYFVATFVLFLLIVVLPPVIYRMVKENRDSETWTQNFFEDEEIKKLFIRGLSIWLVLLILGLLAVCIIGALTSIV